MSIDSFGYQVMSLDELIAALQAKREENPGLGNRPVWIMNGVPLYYPVKAVDSGMVHQRYGTGLFVETGS